MGEGQNSSSPGGGQSSHDTTTSSAPPTPRARILLIEDFPDLAQVLEQILQDAGHEVTAAYAGVQGLLELSRLPFDLVLLDLQIADMSAIGMQRALSDFCRVPIIVMSALNHHWQQQAFDAGATACLPKPFNIDDLLSLIRSILLAERSTPERRTDVRELTPEDLERIRAMPPEQVDALPYGVIRLTRQGTIATYNRYEAEATRYSPEVVRGMRFADVAPCTVVQEFLDTVSEGFARRQADRVLRFVFPHAGARVTVNVRLFYDIGLDQMWLFVSRRRGEARDPQGAQ